jgi:hypothetical protein
MWGIWVPQQKGKARRAQYEPEPGLVFNEQQALTGMMITLLIGVVICLFAAVFMEVRTKL